jgi:DNA-directed RNA polymerase specialized sigma24 family protein
MRPELVTIPLSAIVFDASIYPRLEGHLPQKVQEYARDMASIEAAGKWIAINAENILIDGRHRQLAYRKLHEGDEDVPITVWRYPVISPLETLRLAASLQDRGTALSAGDRIATAQRLYALGLSSQAEIGAALGVAQSTVSGWLSATLKDEKDRQREHVRALWLACHTQREIADAVHVSQGTVHAWVEELIKKSDADILINLTRREQALAAHAIEFEAPLSDFWEHDAQTPDTRQYGSSDDHWIDNLLYFYTQPFDIVVDPFAGAGPMVTWCQKRLRRYWVSDRKPAVEYAAAIRQWDITTGLPKLPSWKDVRLVYLNPPAWKGATRHVSDDRADLASMSREDYAAMLAEIIQAFGKRLSPGAVIALLMSPSQWEAPDRRYTDHIMDIGCLVRLPLQMRFVCPYGPERCTQEMVDWAQANKQLLVLNREIVVWKVPVPDTDTA